MVKPAVPQQFETLRFSGRLSALNLSCEQGGLCKATVNGITVIMRQGLPSAPSKTPWGTYTASSADMSTQYEAYCRKIDEKLCTLQGQSDYFLRPAKAKK